MNYSPAVEDRAHAVHSQAIVMTCHDHVPPSSDLQQLIDGGFTAQSVHIGADVDILARTQEEFFGSIYETQDWCKRNLLSLDEIVTTIDNNPDKLLLVREPADILRAKREGKVGIMLAAEGGKIIEERIELLRIFYRLGLRHLFPTWSFGNALAAGDIDVEDPAMLGDYAYPERLRIHGVGKGPGLSEIGRQVIHEMNRLGIIIDVDHMSRPAMRETMAMSTVPVLCGHTCSKMLVNRLGNKTDAEIRAIADKGGVVGLIFTTIHNTGREKPQATLDEVVAQIDHIVNVGGIDVMALGPDYQDASLSDFNKASAQELSFAAGLENSGKLLNLTRALVAHDYDDDQICKILGGNLLRLFTDVRNGASVARDPVVA
jgi:membrane dipeptidase